MVQKYQDRLKVIPRCYCVKYGNSYLWKFPRLEKFSVLGTHWYGVLFTMLVIIGGTIMNVRFLRRLHATYPVFVDRMYLFVALMYLLTNILLILTATTDPGIVFPEYARKGPNAVVPLMSQSNQGDEEDEEIEVEMNVPRDCISCHICKIITPREKKVGHCYDCGHCIEQLDHHCPWMGQCVGKRNMT
jgi:hypothetical protein